MLSADALPEIESALSRTGYGLAFPPAIEREFQRQRAPQQTATVRRLLSLYVAFSLVALLCDYEARIPFFGLAVIFRAGLGVPLTVLAILCIRRQAPAWTRGLLAVFPMILLTTLSGVLSRRTGGPLASNIMILPSICIFTQTLVAPVPFRYALRGLLVALAAFVFLSLAPLPLPFHPAISPEAPTFTVVAGLAALFERHRRERADRKDFLLSEANRLRLEDILRLNSHLERLSSLDGLTGVFNRRYLDAALARLWLVASHHQRWLGVLMVDIDHFKALNDHAGHQHGDFCLGQVAQILQRTVRAGVDTVARYGGEEFVAILPEANEAEVLVVGERVREAIESAGLQAANGAVVTVSAGAVAVQGRGDLPLTLEEFVAAADHALYQAKRSGRNRVVCSAPLLRKLQTEGI